MLAAALIGLGALGAPRAQPALGGPRALHTGAPAVRMPSRPLGAQPGRAAVHMSSNGSEEMEAGSMPALLERRVPYAQQAVVQLKEVQSEPFYPWAALPLPALLPRLAVVYALFAGVGGWVATNTYSFPTDALQIVLAGNMGGCTFVLLFMLRIVSGWSFVSNRLGEEVLDYEESGWADGFQARKPEEVRARDLYLNEFTVKPVLARMRPLMSALAVATVVSIVAFKLVEGDPNVQYRWARRSVRPLSSAALPPACRLTPQTISSPLSRTLNSADYLSNLQGDDKAAEAERMRAAQSGKPSYCFDRYYKAVAGGGMCD